MPKAAQRHTTKPTSAPHRGLPQTISGDPVVCIAREIERLWDAHHGAEVQKYNAMQKGEKSHEIILGERCDQLTEWRDALELVGTYTVASSLPGGLIQMAWAMNDLRTLAGNLEANERGGAEYDLGGYVERIERLVKSAADLMVSALGKDYERVRKIVETYAHLGERDPNWLLMVDDWVDQAELDRNMIREKEAS